jgi:hypothetical protein
MIIAIMITYFIGCMVFFISNEFNNEQDIAELHTFNTNFNMYDYKDNM